MAAPGMISFLAFLSKTQTSSDSKWGRVAWRKTSGHWPCPFFCPTVSLTLRQPHCLPSPEVSGSAEFLAFPHFISRKTHQVSGLQGPRPCYWTHHSSL